MVHNINKKDIQIISHLREDARMSLTQMSKSTRIPVSTIFDRIKSNDFIVKHTALLDFAKLGYFTRANISIKVDREDKEELKKFLLKNNHVNSLYRINDNFDFLIEGIFIHISDMEEFIDMMESRFKIIEKKTQYILEDIKREGFMSTMNYPFINSQ
ncbi:hypothetical protein C0585_04985 [Candidatus Woesearchaeota archaeon]|nr:MAG: hypothetical protein C0585_04985 [Candidatus Woesearchaeota archaeon]